MTCPRPAPGSRPPARAGGVAWRRVAVLFVLAGCVPVPGREPLDDDAPTIIATVPEEGEIGVDRTKALKFTFGESTCEDCLDPCDLDATSLAGRVRLVPETSGLRVALEPTRCVVRVTVAGGLRAETLFVATVLPGVRDSFGNTTTEPFQLTFRTAAAGADRRAPVYVGSWPPDGDARLGRKSPILLFFDEPIVVPVALTGLSGVRQESRPESFALALLPETTWPAGTLNLVTTRATDLSGNASDAAVSLHFAVPGSDDTQPPTFGGIGSLVPEGDAWRVGWTAATDDRSATSALRYFVYAFPAGETAPEVPLIVTAPGATSALLARGESRWVVRVVAQDEAGNLDTNAALLTSEAP